MSLGFGPISDFPVSGAIGPIPTINSVTPADFDMDNADIDIAGSNFGAAQQYLHLDAGYINTPDHAAYQVADSIIDVRVQIAALDWTPASNASIISQWGSSGNFGWRFLLLTDGSISFGWSADGTAVVDVASTALMTTFALGVPIWVRAVHDPDPGGTRTTQFYTSYDGITWTQLGTTITFGTAGIIFNSTGNVQIGVSGAGGNLPADLIKAEVLIAGTPVLSPDVSSTGQGWAVNDEFGSTGTDTQGRVWTIGGDAYVITNAVYLAAESGRPVDQWMDVDGFGWATTPDSTPLSIDDNLDLRIRVRVDSWATGAIQTLLSKRPTANEWQFRINAANNQLNFVWWATAAPSTSISHTTVAHGLPTNVPVWLRVRRAGTALTFYHSLDDTNDHTTVVWNQFHSATTTAGTINDVSSFVVIGSSNTAGSETLMGDVFAAAIVDDVTTVADPTFSDPAEWSRGELNGSTATDGQGNVWTLDNVAELGENANIRVLGDVSSAVTSRSDTAINLDLTLLTAQQLYELSEWVGAGDRYVVVDTHGVYSLDNVALHRIKAFELAPSANITASGANTTFQLAAPNGKTTGDFGGGRIQDDENPGDTVNIDADEYREDEWSVIATAAAVLDQRYEFRGYPASAPPGTLYVHPQVSLFEGGGGAQNITVTGATETETAGTVTKLSPRTVSVGGATETEAAVAVQADQSKAVGKPTETETANAIAINRGVLAGKASEVETANAVTLDLSGLVGKASETEAAVAVQADQSKLVGLVSETETANAVTLDLTVLVGKATETETAVAVQADQAYPVGKASEVETANAIAINRGVLVGKATETETAGTVFAGRVFVAGKASEVETAGAVQADQSKLVGLASEAETANAVTSPQSIAVGKASETEVAQGAFGDVTLLVGKASETETAGEVTTSGTQTEPVDVATETETANAIAINRGVLVGKASETETANAVTQDLTDDVQKATETETANAVQADQAYPVGLASETETANAVTLDLTDDVGKASEVETANAVQADQSKLVGLASEAETANAVTMDLTDDVGKASETETAGVATVRMTRQVGLASETETANAVTMDLSGLVGKATETETANAVTQDLTDDVVKATETETAGTVTVIQGQTVAVGGASESETANTVLIVDVPELEGYRFRNDDGSETTATWKAVQDTPVGIAADITFRLRTIVNHPGDPVSGDLTIQYKRADEDDTEWRTV